jgi:hypothetical protein
MGIAAAVSAQIKVLRNSEVGQNAAAFGGKGQAAPHNVFRRLADQVGGLAVRIREQYLAANALHQAGNGPHGAAFARAVGPDKGYYVPAFYLNVHALNRVNSAVADVHID